MDTLRFSERVDFTYFVGAGMSLLFFIVSMNFYNGNGMPMGFALASLGAYTGVIIRGIIDKNIWGRTQKRIKLSALIGLISVFVVFLIGSVLLLSKSFGLSRDKINLFLFFEGIGLLILFFIFYLIWFRNLKIWIYSMKKG